MEVNAVLYFLLCITPFGAFLEFLECTSDCIGCIRICICMSGGALIGYGQLVLLLPTAASLFSTTLFTPHRSMAVHCNWFFDRDSLALCQ